MMKKPKFAMVHRIFPGIRPTALLACAVVGWTTGADASALNLYVKPTGTAVGCPDRSNPADTRGSLTNPFPKIQNAADCVVPGDVVNVRAGTYREMVRPAKSGTSASPITFQPYNNEAVTISGADEVTALTGLSWSLFSTPSGADYQIYRIGPFPSGTLPTVDDQAGDYYQGYPTAGTPGEPMVLTNKISANQVFMDNVMKVEARWPNIDDRWPTAGVDLLRPTLAYAGASTSTGNIVDPDLPVRTWTGARVTYWGHTQSSAFTSTVSGQGTNSIQFTDPCAAWATATPGTPYFLSGVPGLLDSKNEWFFDDINPADGTVNTASLYLYLGVPTGTTPGTKVSIKRRSIAVDLRARSYVQVSNIAVFSSTIVTGSRYATDPDPCTIGVYKGLPCSAIKETDQFGSNVSVGVVIDGVSVIYPSHFTNAYHPNTDCNEIQAYQSLSSGVVLDGSSNQLRNSTVAYSAGSGVILRGDHHTVSNNVIHDVDYFGNGNSGINISTRLVGGQNQWYQISNNAVYNTGCWGIGAAHFAYGNDAASVGNLLFSRIGENHIFNTMMLTNDGGGIYISKVNGNGTHIDSNWVNDLWGSLFFGAGIYIDNGAYNLGINANVAWNNAGDGIRLNGISPSSGGTALYTSANNLVALNTFPIRGQARSLAAQFVSPLSTPNSGSGLYNTNLAQNVFGGLAERQPYLDNLTQSAKSFYPSNLFPGNPANPAPDVVNDSLFTDPGRHNFHIPGTYEGFGSSGYGAYYAGDFIPGAGHPNTAYFSGVEPRDALRLYPASAYDTQSNTDAYAGTTRRYYNSPGSAYLRFNRIDFGTGARKFIPVGQMWYSTGSFDVNLVDPGVPKKNVGSFQLFTSGGVASSALNTVISGVHDVEIMLTGGGTAPGGTYIGQLNSIQFDNTQSAFSTIQAEKADRFYRVKVNTTSPVSLTSLDDGDRIMFYGVDFGTGNGANKLKVNVRLPTDVSNPFEVWIDGIGPLSLEYNVGTRVTDSYSLTSTSGSFAQRVIPLTGGGITPVKGIHDVTIVVKGGLSGALLDNLFFAYVP